MVVTASPFPVCFIICIDLSEEASEQPPMFLQAWHDVAENRMPRSLVINLSGFLSMMQSVYYNFREWVCTSMCACVWVCLCLLLCFILVVNSYLNRCTCCLIFRMSHWPIQPVEYLGFSELHAKLHFSSFSSLSVTRCPLPVYSRNFNFKQMELFSWGWRYTQG